MNDERRKHARVPTSITVAWEGATGKHEARTTDLSMTGCFVDTVGKVAIGEVIDFKLALPSGEWIELQGEVIYEYPNVGFGVRFTSTDEAREKRLGWLIKAEGEKQR